jgi:hypothetical protein
MENARVGVVVVSDKGSVRGTKKGEVWVQGVSSKKCHRSARWRLLLAVCLWQGPIPIVHHHDLPVPQRQEADHSQATLFLWRHVVEFHGASLEQLRLALRQNLPAGVTHLCWHFHFVLPRQARHTDHPDDSSPTDQDFPVITGRVEFSPCGSPFLAVGWPKHMGRVSAEACWKPREDRFAFRPRDFVSTLVDGSSLRAVCGVARC